MTHAYVDSSVVLRHVMGEPSAFRGLDKFEKLYSSELLRIEAMRTIDRLRIQHQWPDAEVALRVRIYHAIEDHINIAGVTSDVLERAAGAFSIPIRTLDALHVATFVCLQNQLPDRWCFVTHDIRQADAITACGYEVVR